jgi:hypothetical protein
LLFRGDPKGALEKAKDGAKREARLAKYREENNIAEGSNFDLTYAIYFNLGNA